MNERPTHKQRAAARADAIQFLVANPGHDLAPALRVLVESTAPLMREQAVALMVQHTNEEGGWPASPNDVSRAHRAIAEPDKERGGWAQTIRAQWKTLFHFMGGGP